MLNPKDAQSQVEDQQLLCTCMFDFDAFIPQTYNILSCSSVSNIK